MAGYRKLLLVSSIGLAAIVMALYSLPLVDWNPAQHQPASEVTQLQSGTENQVRNPYVSPGNGNQEMQSSIEVQPTTEKLQDISPASNNISLSGWVGTEFGEYIAGETVVLYSPSQKARYATVTGNFGEYKFVDIKPGWDYILKISPQGMFDSYTKSQIKLGADQEIHNIILQPIPTGMLIGRIEDPYDRPVTNLELSVTTVEKEYWTTRVLTDANGTFSVSEFPKGKFKVTIKGPQNFRASGLEFDPDSAIPVILTVDLGPYNLRGSIYDESGQTFDGAEVYLNWVLLDKGVRTHSTRKFSVNATGKFQFTGLGPGNHELVITVWRGNTFKQTVKKTVNLGVDSGELIIVLNTM